MSRPAARVGELHVCPMIDGLKPHVGGPVMAPGAVTCLIGGIPAARVGDMALCVGPVDTIVQGSMSVLIAGKPAARIGDLTSHGGAIASGFPTCLIGDSGGASSAMLHALSGRAAFQAERTALLDAARAGRPFCAICEATLASEQAMPTVSVAALPTTAGVQRRALLDAARSGRPFCAMCAKASAEG